MTAKQYVNGIVRQIKCGDPKKREIKRQLQADVELKLSQENSLEDVISQMGTVDEIAAGFNENISAKEQKKYARNKAIRMAVLIVLLLAVISALTYWKMPKGIEIEKSKYFNASQVEEVMKKTVEQLDAGEFEDLKKNSISEMIPFLNYEEWEKAKDTIMEEPWGERTQFGPVYLAEVVQGNTHCVVGEITVTYEKVSVTYRLTYDQDMRLSGLYVR